MIAHQHRFRGRDGQVKTCNMLTYEQVRCPGCGTLVGFRDYRKPAAKGYPAEIFCSIECANQVPCYEEMRAHLDGVITWLDENSAERKTPTLKG